METGCTFQIQRNILQLVVVRDIENRRTGMFAHKTVWVGWQEGRDLVNVCVDVNVQGYQERLDTLKKSKR